MNRLTFYGRAFGLLLFAVFGAGAVLSSNTSHPTRAIVFSLMSGASFVMVIAARWVTHLNGLRR